VKHPFYKNIHFIFISGGLVVNLLLGVIFTYINTGTIMTISALPSFYKEAWPMVIQTLVIIYFLYYSIQYFNKKYHDNPNGFQRFLKESLFVMIVGFGIMEVFRWFFILYMVVPEADTAFLQKKLRQIQMIDLTFLIVIYAFMTSFRIFRYLQQKQLEVLKWQREYTQSQFETMKNQLNPHFLFNSLSTLTSLVYADADVAEKFIQKLSKTYRYLLEQRDKELVPLTQEYEFVQSYLFLLEQRFGKKIRVTLEPIKANGYQLPPHTLMILLEYIVDNNTMSSGKPLQITLKQENDQLSINYNHQPKPVLTGKTGEQVVHLQEQFHFISGHELILEQERDQGRVQIPLIQSK
jgi:sensor histidine kinase YesM